MIEKVNPGHPDKMADRIAGALVDLAYRKNENCRIAVEVLIGHGACHIIAETSEVFSNEEVKRIVKRIAGEIEINLVVVKQDPFLAANQKDKLRCGDNGIFKGVPLTEEQKALSKIARDIYQIYPSDGKYILDENKLIICQSKAASKEIEKLYPQAIVNPLGEWTGGTDVDTGATNRKLGSDMADSITGGGLHGKDLSKGDVSINIYAFLKAQKINQTVQFSCAIGDETVDGRPYGDIVRIAKEYIDTLGGFEKLAEWGLY
ncbi:MAG: S-adenosylmethionine synthetase N-terminal domain-containing protein [Erysipelotrichaceae bacterium]|jgi:S-adenosylmethionine synthetase